LSKDDESDELLKNKRFSSTAFSTDLGGISSVIPYDKNDKFFVLKVESINPKRTKAFEEVRSEMLNIWIQEKSAQLKEQKVKDVLAALKNSEDINKVIAKYGINAPKSAVKLSKLDPQGSSIIRPLQDEVYKTAKGQFTISVQDSKGDYHFAKVIDSLPISDEQAKKYSNEIAASVSDSVGEEMMHQYILYLREKYKIKVYDEVINS
jgi:hypothetical protein